MFLTELPDSGSDRVQPEVHTTLEIQEDGFAVQLAEHDIFSDVNR